MAKNYKDKQTNNITKFDETVNKVMGLALKNQVRMMITKQGDLANVVKMQKKENKIYEQVLEYVKKYLSLPETTKQRKLREQREKIQDKQDKMKLQNMKNELKQQGDHRFSFQEEVELIQRKFLRHISKMIRADEIGSDLPKLLVFDFLPEDKSDMGSQENIGGECSSSNSFSEKPVYYQPKIRNVKKLTSLNGKFVEMKPADDWQEENFCIRALCEDEQGWHPAGNPLSLINLKKDEIVKILKEAAPYLARLYAILKQSSVSMACLSSSAKGEQFMDFIRKEGINIKNFRDAYRTINRNVVKHREYEQFNHQLNRCYLRIGKISWLCIDHQNKTGITLLPPGTVSMHSSILHDEDVMLSEFLKESDDWPERKVDDILVTTNIHHGEIKSLPRVEESKNEAVKNYAEKSQNENHPKCVQQKEIKQQNKDHEEILAQRTAPTYSSNRNEQKKVDVEESSSCSVL